MSFKTQYTPPESTDLTPEPEKPPKATKKRKASKKAKVPRDPATEDSSRYSHKEFLSLWTKSLPIHPSLQESVSKLTGTRRLITTSIQKPVSNKKMTGTVHLGKNKKQQNHPNEVSKDNANAGSVAASSILPAPPSVSTNDPKSLLTAPQSQHLLPIPQVFAFSPFSYPVAPHANSFPTHHIPWPAPAPKQIQQRTLQELLSNVIMPSSDTKAREAVQASEPSSLDAKDMEGKCWEYIDLNSVVRGPFSAKEMAKWHAQGYMKPTLFIRLIPEPKFYQISEMFPSPLKPFVDLPQKGNTAAPTGDGQTDAGVTGLTLEQAQEETRKLKEKEKSSKNPKNESTEKQKVPSIVQPPAATSSTDKPELDHNFTTISSSSLIKDTIEQPPLRPLPQTLIPALPPSLPAELPTHLPVTLQTQFPAQLPSQLPTQLPRTLPQSLPQTILPPQLPLPMPKRDQTQTGQIELTRFPRKIPLIKFPPQKQLPTVDRFPSHEFPVDDPLLPVILPTFQEPSPIDNFQAVKFPPPPDFVPEPVVQQWTEYFLHQQLMELAPDQLSNLHHAQVEEMTKRTRYFVVDALIQYAQGVEMPTHYQLFPHDVGQPLKNDLSPLPTSHSLPHPSLVQTEPPVLSNLRVSAEPFRPKASSASGDEKQTADHDQSPQEYTIRSGLTIEEYQEEVVAWTQRQIQGILGQDDEEVTKALFSAQTPAEMEDVALQKLGDNELTRKFVVELIRLRTQ
ncbi:hypothetical protein BLNAU_11773 [Blattamonas nauphoetae]|uniref:GYF domain-containing protein n=1 Tax=Blattamonas nauphoetae TaxID=2049346 RepID=A0ABQ9XQ38_9EUKA|nr:hypothetical protein BLNAU_11773 [Blattamonas nauphoetae]